MHEFLYLSLCPFPIRLNNLNVVISTEAAAQAYLSKYKKRTWAIKERMSRLSFKFGKIANKVLIFHLNGKKLRLFRVLFCLQIPYLMQH